MFANEKSHKNTAEEEKLHRLNSVIGRNNSRKNSWSSAFRY